MRHDGFRFYRCTRCGTWLVPWVCTPCLLCRVRLWGWLRLRSLRASTPTSAPPGDAPTPASSAKKEE